MLLISKCQRTSQAVASVSSAVKPTRGPIFSAISAPRIEWSPPRPFAMSWSSVAKYSTRRESMVGMIAVANGNSSFKAPVSILFKMPIAISECSSTVYV